MTAGASLVDRRVQRTVPAATGPVVMATLGALALHLAGWHGTDYAAAAYRVEQFRRHGLVLWDTSWYGGNYPLGYSVLFPPIGALLGLPATGVIGAGVCTWAFDDLVTRWWGRRPLGAWLFPLAALLEVGIGQFPYLTGEAFALCALVAATRRRNGLAIAAGVAASLCSGVACAFLAVAALGWAWSARDRRRALLALTLIPLAVLLAYNLAFPGTGSFPYPWAGMAWVLVACAAAFTPPLRAAPAVRAGAVLYGALALGSFLIPSPMGGNASRLAQSVGIPLLACFALSPTPGQTGGRGWRAALAVAMVPLLIWEVGPGRDVVSGVSRAPDTTAGFYRPLIAELAARAPQPVRVEVVPTKQHWESDYVAQHDALARGWERQLDRGDNPIFYRPGALDAATYRRWLLDNGVSFVALPDTSLDYAAVAEGRLLRSGTVAGLTLVWRSAQWELWRVDQAPGLVDGPGQVTRLGPDAVTVDARQAGPLTVRVRWTRYWAVSSGDACIARNPGGWTTVDARKAGVVHLDTTFDPFGGSGHC